MAIPFDLEAQLAPSNLSFTDGWAESGGGKLEVIEMTGFNNFYVVNYSGVCFAGSSRDWDNGAGASGASHRTIRGANTRVMPDKPTIQSKTRHRTCDPLVGPNNYFVRWQPRFGLSRLFR